MGTKKCSRCYEVKSYSEYYSRYGKALPFHPESRCRVCKNQATSKRKTGKRRADPAWRNHDNVLRKIRQGRSAKKQALVKWADRKKILKIYRECYAKGEEFEVDHVVPFRGKNVCGLHVHENLQILTKKANSEKQNKHAA